MDPLKKVGAAAGALKIFPLPPVVLFPGSTVALHIFEPRYRQLIADALASDGVMALGGLEPGDRLSTLCCAGLIAAFEPLPDGRSLIAVAGVARASVRAELPMRRLYREVEVEILEDPPYQGPEEEPLRQAVLELASRLPADTVPSLLHQAALQSGGPLADVVASAVVSDLARRQALFGELDVGKRLRAVLGEVSGLLAQLVGASPRPQLN